MGITSGSFDHRWSKHVSAAQHGSKYHFHRAIRKHGINSFDGTVLEICDSREELLVEKLVKRSVMVINA